MAQQLRVLAEYRSLGFSTHPWELTNACDPRFGEPETLSGSQGYLHVCIHMQMQTKIKILNVFK